MERIGSITSGFQVIRMGPEHESVNVSRLAAEVGLGGLVFFSPDAWAFCEPRTPSKHSYLNQIAQEDNARQVLRGLRRGLMDNYGNARFTFYPQGTELQTEMFAEILTDKVDVEIVVSLNKRNTCWKTQPS